MLNARLTTLCPYVLGKLQAVLKDWNGTAPGPEIQVFVDAWRALEVWKGSGEVISTVSELAAAPVIPDLEIAVAKLESGNRAYELDGEQWILVARIDANRKFRIPRTVRAFVADSANLVWLTEVDGGLAAGHFDLQVTPRVRDLRLD